LPTGPRESGSITKARAGQMTDISIQEFCGALYCAQVSERAFTVNERGRIAVVARSVADGVEEYYRVEFDGVSGFSWRDDRDRAFVPDDRYRLEVSVIELERLPDTWRVWMNPYYHTVIEFHCVRISLNGAQVRGEGRWLQDELPEHQPGCTALRWLGSAIRSPFAVADR
jgi:hypothetical protein